MEAKPKFKVRRFLSRSASSARVRANRSRAYSASRPSWLRYGVAVLAVGVVLVAKLLLDPLIAEQAPFLLLALAVVVGAWFGGLGPGLLATVLGAIIADYFFLPPVGSFTKLDVAFLALVGVGGANPYTETFTPQPASPLSATCPTQQASIKVTKLDGTATGELNEDPLSIQPDKDANFRIVDCKYMYNLATSSLSGAGTYKVYAVINGTTASNPAMFDLK